MKMFCGARDENALRSARRKTLTSRLTNDNELAPPTSCFSGRVDVSGCARRKTLTLRLANDDEVGPQMSRFSRRVDVSGCDESSRIRKALCSTWNALE